MHRAVSLVLILSLVATVAVPVWASQPAPVKHMASFGVSQVADDGWRDKWRDSRFVKSIRGGCAVWGVGVLQTKGSICLVHWIGAVICTVCTVFAVVDAFADPPND